MKDEKIRFQMRISEDTERKIQAAYPLSDSRSKNEFVEKTLRFYCEYLSGKDCSDVLPPMLVSALRSTVQLSEDRTNRILFKLAVETSMMMRVMAIAMEISPEELNEIRGKCIQDVKKSNGALSFQNVMKEERGSEK